MPEPSKNEDDLDLALPSLDGEDENGEEHSVPPNAEDIGFRYYDDDDDEPIDLDTSVGFDRYYDDWEIYAFTGSGENSTLSSEEEEEDTAYDAEAELIGGEEEGWLDDSEPLNQEDWEVDDLIADTLHESEEDCGEEGVDEKHEVTGLDDQTTLPPLDCTDDFESNDDQENDSFGQKVLEEVADPRLIESEDE